MLDIADRPFSIGFPFIYVADGQKHGKFWFWTVFLRHFIKTVLEDTDHTILWDRGQISLLYRNTRDLGQGVAMILVTRILEI